MLGGHHGLGLCAFAAVPGLTSAVHDPLRKQNGTVY